MNETKLKILLLLKQPTTIKELQSKSGLKWSNLSLHLKDLKAKGFIMDVGKQGKSKVIQINMYNVNKYLLEQHNKLQEMML